MSVLKLPLDRLSSLNVATQYSALRREAPLVRVTTPTGDPAWLVLGYDEVKQIFGDPRLGRSHPSPSGRPKSPTPRWRAAPAATTKPNSTTTPGCARC